MLTKEKKSRPSSLLPANHEWGVGVSAVGRNFSPYEKVNRFYDWIQERAFTVDHQRAKLVTEAYQKYENEVQVVKMAKVIKHIVENVDINIWSEELVVGEVAAPFRASPVWPEFSYWVIDDLKNHPFNTREFDR